MRRQLFLYLIIGINFLLTHEVISQVSIDEEGIPPDPSAMLDVRSHDKGVLVPRMTAAEMLGISNPATGLLVFCSENNQFYCNKGTLEAPSWTLISSQWIASGDDIYYDQGNVGIGTANPTQQLELTGNLELQPTSAEQAGILYKRTEPWMHDFSVPGTQGNNLFIGQNAGNLTLAGSASGDEGSYNTLIGCNVGTNLTSGHGNTAVGSTSLLNNTSGSFNTAIGFSSLQQVTDQGHNTAVGFYALRNNRAASNTAVGSGALEKNIDGWSNTALGQAAHKECQDCYQNTALGSGAMQNLAYGYACVAIGSGALGATDSAVTNVAIGNSSLQFSKRACNVGVGNSTLMNSVYGLDNTAIGTGALISLVNGSENVGVGVYALNDNTDGWGNTVIGQYSMWKNMHGGYNVAIGNRAGYWNNGSGNIFIGDSAAYHQTGSNRLVIDNSPTANPLIFGEFDSNRIGINTSQPASTLHIGGDFEYDDNAYGFFRFDSAEAVVPIGEPNTWYQVTSQSASLLTMEYSKNITISNDTIIIGRSGIYSFNARVSYSGTNDELWQMGFRKVGGERSGIAERKTLSDDVINSSCIWITEVAVNDKFLLEINNSTDTDDPVFRSILITIVKIDAD